MGGGGGVCRKFESFVENLGGFAPPPTGKSEFPPLEDFLLSTSNVFLCDLRHTPNSAISKKDSHLEVTSCAF